MKTLVKAALVAVTMAAPASAQQGNNAPRPPSAQDVEAVGSQLLQNQDFQTWIGNVRTKPRWCLDAPPMVELLGVFVESVDGRDVVVVALPTTLENAGGATVASANLEYGRRPMARWNPPLDGGALENAQLWMWVGPANSAPGRFQVSVTTEAGQKIWGCIISLAPEGDITWGDANGRPLETDLYVPGDNPGDWGICHGVFVHNRRGNECLKRLSTLRRQ